MSERIFYKYPHTNQLRQVMKGIKDQFKFIGVDKDNNPILKMPDKSKRVNFTGTVKLDGTNGAVVYTKEGDMYCQSRNRVLEELESDNLGFRQFIMNNEERKENLRDILKLLIEKIQNSEPDYIINAIVVYGEFVGQGIAGGTGISKLSKSFFIFELKGYGKDKVTGQELEFTINKLFENSIKELNDLNIYNLIGNDLFPHYHIILTTEEEEMNKSKEKMEKMLQEVEEQCPVSKYFGVEGIGEGIVFTSDVPQNDIYLKFKIKGEKHYINKHNRKSKIQLTTEVIQEINKFLDYAITENRMKQAIDFIKEQGKKVSIDNIGMYLKWIAEDVKREEKDVIIENKLEWKEIAKRIPNKAKPFYLDYILEGGENKNE